MAAIGTMMVLASAGQQKREAWAVGRRASHCVRFRWLPGHGSGCHPLLVTDPAISYGLVFACEGVLFVIAASLARHIHIATGEVSSEISWATSPAEAGDGGTR